jgi:hypothetical protein
VIGPAATFESSNERLILVDVKAKMENVVAAIPFFSAQAVSKGHETI